jgi:hypothetical protein
VDDLKAQIALSYSQHPEFQFEQQEFQLERSALAAFNDAYDLARTCGGRLSARQFDWCVQKCNRELTTAFDQLKGQTTDSNEACFLQELRGECERLVNQELRYFRRRTVTRGVSLNGSRARADALNLLRSRHFLGKLPAEAVREILDVGAAALTRFRETARRGGLRRDELSLYQGPVVRAILHILNREFRKQGALDALGAYTGERMWAGGASLELSVPQATWWANSFAGLPRSPKTLYAHIDETIASPKAIVYLSDVDRMNGPTSYFAGAYESLSLNPLQELVGRVVGNVGNAADSPLRAYYAKQYHQSMTSERFRRHFMKLPADMRFNSHFGWEILPESAAENSLCAREQFMVGEGGTYIVFDGARLLHRGGMLERGERIALQVVFSKTNLIRRMVRGMRTLWR